MKKLLFTCFLVLVTTVGFSQDWILEWYKSRNRQFLTNEISQKVNQGWLPVGIEVAPDPTGQVISLFVLYINDQSLGITAWYLNTYTSDNALEKGINVMGQEDYVPKEVAYYDGIYYVLFLRFENTATAWTLQNTVYSNQGLSSTINKYDAMGYLPFGYTLVNGSLNLLFVEILLNSTISWQVEVYNSISQMKRGINKDILIN